MTSGCLGEELAAFEKAMLERAPLLLRPEDFAAAFKIAAITRED
jgi:hypothetical protein